MKNGTAAAPKFFVFRFEDVEVHEREFCVVKAGEVLPVEPKTFSVLLYLLRNPERLISKEELLDAVWSDAEVTEHSLTRAIAKLRRLLGDDFHDPRYVATVSKVGYRIVCRVETVEDRVDRPAVETAQSAFLPDGGVALPEEASGTSAAAGASSVLSEALADETPQASRARSFTRWGLIAGLAAAGGAAVLGWFLHRSSPTLRVTDTSQITHDGRRKGLFGSDGVRLYLNFYPDPQPVGLVAATGGEIARKPIDLPTPWVIDVSPDGSTLLVMTMIEDKGSLWSVKAVGDLKRRLVDSGVDTAAWSPDGNSVVYSLQNGDLYVMRADGSGGRRLASIPEVSGSALMARIAWSPDSKTIRFDRNNRIWEISPDGTGLREFLPKWHPAAWQCCGAWTPDGRYFLFLEWQVPGASYLNFPPSQIWALDEGRRLPWSRPSEPMQLTSGPIRWGRPLSSADGKKIYDRGVTLNAEVVRWNEHVQQFQPELGGISAEFVAFSPDGKSVAYVTFPEGVLWRADLDGSHPTQLSDPPLYPLAPLWSPDGRQILFYADDAAGKTRSYLMSAQGGAPKLVLPNSQDEQEEPSWSPKGDRIVMDWVEAGGKVSLRIVDLSSRRMTPIPGSENLEAPLMSPDGRFITGLTVDNLDLKVFDDKTQRWSTLEKGVVESPVWSHDGRFIYFLRPFDNPGVFRKRPEGGKAERMIDLKGFRFDSVFMSASFIWLGLDPEDAPMLMRDAGGDDIYALSLESK